VRSSSFWTDRHAYLQQLSGLVVCSVQGQRAAVRRISELGRWLLKAIDQTAQRSASVREEMHHVVVGLRSRSSPPAQRLLTGAGRALLRSCLSKGDDRQVGASGSRFVDQVQGFKRLGCVTDEPVGKLFGADQ